MEKLNITPSVTELLIQNAVDYGLATALTITPEQIEKMQRENELFDKGMEICPNCHLESKRELENCEFCGNDKIPF